VAGDEEAKTFVCFGSILYSNTTLLYFLGFEISSKLPPSKQGIEIHLLASTCCTAELPLQIS
jgi:hypothetical protein